MIFHVFIEKIHKNLIVLVEKVQTLKLKTSKKQAEVKSLEVWTGATLIITTQTFGDCSLPKKEMLMVAMPRQKAFRGSLIKNCCFT